MAKRMGYHENNQPDTYLAGPFVMVDTGRKWRVEVQDDGANCPVLPAHAICEMARKAGFSCEENVEATVDWLNEQVRLGGIVKKRDLEGRDGSWVPRVPKREELPPPAPTSKDCSRPDDVKEFPGVEVGDLLYSYNIAMGLDRYVVVAKTPEGFVRVVHAHLQNYRHISVDWGTDDLFESERAAVEVAACKMREECIEYIAFCGDALNAVLGGEDLERFRKGIPDPPDRDQATRS